MPASVDFLQRPATDSDRPFLYALHCETMRALIAKTWGWNEEWQRAEFDRQFRSYETTILECEGRQIGAIVVERKPRSIYVHQLQLLPEYQRKGIGTAVMRTVIGQAAGTGRSVTLSVIDGNDGAKQLYARLGFEETGFEAPFFRMCRRSV